MNDTHFSWSVLGDDAPVQTTPYFKMTEIYFLLMFYAQH